MSIWHWLTGLAQIGAGVALSFAPGAQAAGAALIAAGTAYIVKCARAQRTQEEKK